MGFKLSKMISFNDWHSCICSFLPAILRHYLHVTYPPPGDLIQNTVGIPKTTYPILGIEAWILVNAIINDVIYGVIIWLIYSMINKLFFVPQKEVKVVVENPT